MRTISEGQQSAVRILKLVPVASTYCVDTGRVVIGRSYIPGSPRVISRDAEKVQTALLDPRTQTKPTPLARIAGAVWGWC